MDAPREIPFHQSANRPHLLLGGDRELVLVFGVMAAMLIFAVMTWWSIVAGLVLWHVYVRHIRYRAFYPAKSRLTARPTTTRMRWK